MFGEREKYLWTFELDLGGLRRAEMPLLEASCLGEVEYDVR